jgi:hypothetical protein
LEHPNAMRDKASGLANDIEHIIHCSKLVERSLLTMTRKTAVDNMPLKMTHLLFACARSRDWARSTENNQLKYCIPSTTIQLEWKATSGDKRNRSGKFLCCLSYLAILAGTDICCIILSILAIHRCRLPRPCWSGECEAVPSFPS